MAALLNKEANERGLFYAFAIVIMALVAASMPFWFTFSLKAAMSRPANEITSAVLLNFRSYSHFITAQWGGRTLPQLLFLIALVTGSQALASEREAKTLPLLGALGAPLRSIVMAKFLVAAFYISVAALLTAAVIAVHSSIAGMSYSLSGLMLTSFVALLNAFAFLSVAFLGSALASRTPFAALYSLVIGFSLVALLVPFGLNGMALPDELFARDGTLDMTHLIRSVTAACVIALLALGGSIAVTEERGAA